MPPIESSGCVTRRVHLGNGVQQTVVWVRGEHDIATRSHLLDTIAQAAGLDDADIVVDLSGVTFMDASTAGALVAARQRAGASSRSLCVRDPSPLARRVLDICGLALLIDDHPMPAAHVATALGTWIAVPPNVRDSSSAHPPGEEQDAPQQDAQQLAVPQEPARVLAWRRVEPARSIQPPRASS